ncbi:FKBP-type peptidyl-prolyl cis-trans isomerase [Porticoccus sp. W117]|uniref:FKBP-type peptidyl-prolyl cis-trans isomerase n=1 Tax=Porticoccus sp. W117 TaxID=3054777 RepID=UPI002597F1C4|nr:FKBP-type peptidyl-prolyl cis-trans isomerase [Porticoccus sp. W117]MDM3870870.1 FKBP-type peptidyl-prolyl cis-trans isomerase [Porticoccus sp. W117]
MNKILPIASAVLVAGVLAGCGQEKKSEPLTLESKDNKASYLLGYELTKQLQREGVTPHAEALAQGARDALASTPAQVSDETVAALVASTAGNYVVVRRETLAREVAQTNLEAGQAFLAENSQKDGVVTTESGLQYKVITAGEGASPNASDTVEVHYHGTLIDGTVFDSSVQRDQKISFPLNRVIPGWTEGLQLMKEGGKYEFYIPSELAYGPNPRPGPIGPNAVLVFEVELFRVNPAS